MSSSILLILLVLLGLVLSVHCNSHYYSTNVRSIKTKVIDITFSVKQKNLDTLEKLLYEVSIFICNIIYNKLKKYH